jgi:putative ABC transport system substrate-binding protein
VIRRRLAVAAAAVFPGLGTRAQGGAANRSVRIAFLSGFVADANTHPHRAQIGERCARMRLPSVWGRRDFIADGAGLASYQSDFRVVFERAGALVDRILRGADPAEIPFEQSTKLELVINLRAAKAMGIVVPAALRLQADEVIE